jgi:metallophosphoesterase superfamily enzyme
VFWIRRNTLIVADLHLGKSASLRAGSIPIPQGTTAEDLERINRILERTGAERLLILGDVLHSKNARKNLRSQQIALWRSTWNELLVTVVRGNHDVQAGNLPEQIRFVYSEDLLFEAPFAFSHQPCFFTDY